MMEQFDLLYNMVRYRDRDWVVDIEWVVDRPTEGSDRMVG